MKPRYVVIDEFERDKFEKEWQMPYGYFNESFNPTFDPKEAVEYLKRLVNVGNVNPTTTIVEKISDEGRELYYRI